MTLEKLLNGQNLKEFADDKFNLLIKENTTYIQTLDNLTPYFLQVMEAMPPMAQSIVHYLIMTKKDLSDFLTTYFLSKKLHEESKEVSVYCKYLYDNGCVERQKTTQGFEYKINSQIFYDWYRFRYSMKK